MMQENRTFDHYFSSLTVPGQTVDGASPTATNPSGILDGGMISRFHQAELCFDNPAEEWDQVHREVDDGGMDGFARESGLTDPAHDPSGSRAMGYYDESDLPFAYALARAFAISDRHFASVLANTWPNRLYYFAGTSFGDTGDEIPPQTDRFGDPYPTLFSEMNDAGVSWSFYCQDICTLGILVGTAADNGSHIHPLQQFYEDAAAGALPSVTYVEGSDLLGGVSPDEDPPADPQVGQALVASVVSAVTRSPLWPTSAMFLSYDEPGGLYDHVYPPPACVPDDIPPSIPDGGFHAEFNQLGLRVPLIAVSPYARRGYVSHQVTDHTSILRFIAARFGLPALTRRDANATPPFDLFDFNQPNLMVPALPDAGVDTQASMACAAEYPPSQSP
jgi:phospholipase C